MKNKTLIPILIPTVFASSDSVNGLLITNGVLHKPVAGGEYRRCVQGCSIANYLYLCSNAEIKEGDWFFECFGNGDKKLRKNRSKNIIITQEGITLIKIEFTTDPDLIANGIPAIDGNTKAYIEDTDPLTEQDFLHPVNFLEEFCKRWNEKNNKSKVHFCYGCDTYISSAEIDKKYNHKNCKGDKNLGVCIDNQKDNQKVVDVEKLAQDIFNKHIGLNQEMEYKKIEVNDVWNCIREALQSKAGGFSESDINSAMNRIIDYYEEKTDMPIVDFKAGVIKSLAKESQPKKDIVIEYNDGKLIFK